MGFFILGIYFPLTLVVVCSWVAFWIVKTDTPSRTALGIITILSVTKIGFGGKAKPKVGYSTALDIYIIICFFFTFTALLEFLVINFIGMFVQRYKAREEAEAVEKEAKSVREEKQEGEGEMVMGEKRAMARVRRGLPRIPSLLLYTETQYVVDRLDELARKVFPLTFLATRCGLVFCGSVGCSV